MQQRTNATAPARAPGIFETIAGAMSAVLARPLLLVLPVLIDAYFWLGIRLSPNAMTGPLARWIRDVGPDEPGPDAVAVAGDLERLSDFSPLVALFVPSLLAGADRSRVADVWGGVDVGFGSWWWVPAAVLALLVAGVGIGMAFRVPLAVEVRGGPGDPRSLGKDLILAWLRYLGFIGLGLLAVTALAVPVGVFAVAMLVVGVNVVPLLALAIALPAFAIAVLLGFVPDAIVVNRVGPLRACYLSFGVVRRNFWASVGLAVVAWLTSSGLVLVLERMLATPVGVVVAVATYAFIATGLALAQMQFFYDRLRRWRLDIPSVGSRPAP